MLLEAVARFIACDRHGTLEHYAAVKERLVAPVEPAFVTFP